MEQTHGNESAARPDRPEADPRGRTSIELRRAIDGDPEGWRELHARLTPLLEAQARYRLRGPLAKRYEPSDLVNDVWVVAVARLGDLRPRDGRYTPVLMRFLATTLLRRVNELLRRHLGRQTTPLGDLVDEELEAIAREMTSVAAAAARSETAAAVRATLDELPAAERELLVMRGIEGAGNQVVARRLGIQERAASMRYRRTLQRLEKRLPAGVLAALD